MLRCSNLHLLRHRKSVLAGITATFSGATAIVGPNAAGKSSLLQILAGVTPPYTRWHGDIFYNAIPHSTLSPRTRAQLLAWLPQSAPNINDPIMVADFVALGQYYWHKHKAAEVEHSLACWNLLALANREVMGISGGELQRALLARCWVGQRPILLLDEPLKNLDPPHQADAIKQMQLAAQSGTTVVVVLHELYAALHMDNIVVMRDGAIMAAGKSSDPLIHRAIEAVFAQRVKIVKSHDGWQAILQI